MDCPHEFIFGGLCAACGKDVAHLMSKQSVVKVASIDRNMHVSKAIASHFEQESYATLLKKRKLLLVCDLDNTLICAQEGQFKRPFVDEFLEKVGKLFEFSLYTLGGKDHARNSLAIIDPSKKHFKHVVTREALDADSKRLDYLVVDPRTVLILDDNVQVWPHQLKNLVVSPHYVGSKSDTFLQWVIPLLVRLHEKFFKALEYGEDADVRKALQEEREGVLNGVAAVFSGFSHYPESIDPKEYSEWQLMEMYGGKCFYHLEDHLAEVTHLIAHQSGTVRAAKAAQNNIPVVHTSWLLNCFAWFQKVPENVFEMKVAQVSSGSEDNVQKLASQKPKRKAPGIAHHHVHSQQQSQNQSATSSSHTPKETSTQTASLPSSASSGTKRQREEIATEEPDRKEPERREKQRGDAEEDDDNDEDEDDDFLLARLEQAGEDEGDEL